MSYAPDVRKILFLASSPEDESRISFDREVRDIREGLQRSKLRSRFSLDERLAVRPEDLHRALLDIEPEIVHFCGHGGGEKGLMLQSTTERARLVSTEALAGLFREFPQIECVLLNGCSTEVQAEAIQEHVPYVIGMKEEIGNSAIRFAVAFYDSLGAGRSVEDAYRIGCSSMAIHGFPSSRTPVLKKGRSQASNTSFESMGRLSQQQLHAMLAHYRLLAAQSSINADAHHAMGLVYLQLQLHDLALQHFQRSIDLDPGQADSHYYLAMALLRGRRPRIVSLREIRNVESHLQAAAQLDGRAAKHDYFLGLLRYDYYLGNGLGQPRPSYQELFAAAEHKTYDAWEMERLLASVPVRDPALLAILRRA